MSFFHRTIQQTLKNRPKISSLPITREFIRSFATMDQPLSMAFIENTPKDPVEMFSNIIKSYKTTYPQKPFIPMDIATLDDKFGVLNRTVVYRGLEDNHIIFVTEKNSVKYANLMKDPRISVCFLLDIMQENGIKSIWQVRLIGTAAELSPNKISNLWTEEPAFAKIRSRISVCGQPVDFAKHKDDFDKLLKEYQEGKDSLPQTNTYTAFKILPKIWDFYKSEPNCVADRVQYRKGQSDAEDEWSIMHVAS